MFQAHRERFRARLAGERAAAIVPTGKIKIRNHDSEYRFRPRSDFYYLTGFREPDAVLVLRPRSSGCFWCWRRAMPKAAPKTGLRCRGRSCR